MRDDAPVVLLDTDSATPQPESDSRRRRRGMSANTATVLWILLVVGVLALWVVAYARLLSGVEMEADQRGLYNTFREELALATAPVGGTIEPGAPVAVIDAPEAGIDSLVVVEGTSSEFMRSGPGHRRNSPLPGQAGSSVIYGRAVTFGGPFGSISQLQAGDSVAVTTGLGEFTYEVEGVRRPGDPLPVPLEEGESRLILVSSEGAGYLDGWAAQTPVYVDAVLEGDVVDTPTGRLTQVSPAEEAMATSTASLMALVLWLQLLLVVVVAWVWASRRWTVWQTWLVAVPVFMATLWGATSAAFGLLPNLL